MRRAVVWILAIAGVVVFDVSLARPQAYELVDLASAYSTYWDDSRNLPGPERIAGFKARFETLLPGFFTARRVGWMTDAQYDDAIARSFENFPGLRARFVATTSKFSGMLEPAHRNFMRAFPDLRPIGPIYIVHSLGEFDGGTRPMAGHDRLMFGIDVIAQLHDFADERPFFHHELFHLYHTQSFFECEQMWCALWMEGLATLAAQRLNPRATDAELLLSSPEPLRPNIDRNRTAAICAVAARLDSTDPADYAGLFSGGPALAGLPPRGGYYVGFLVAQEAARAVTLAKLAHLENDAARRAVNAALARLATCPVSP